MRGFRKFIGLLITIFIGLPTLFGIIWAVGLTRAVVSSEFFSEVPQEFIERVPTLIDEVLVELERGDSIKNEDTRSWIKAIASAETSPKAMLEKTGILDWLKNELSQSLEEISLILRGEIAPRQITLNMRPLKAALVNEEVNKYLIEVINKLPPCNNDQVQEWLAVVSDPEHRKDLPPCRPLEAEGSLQVLNYHWRLKVEEIPDEVDLMHMGPHDYWPNRGFNIAKSVVSLTYFLFLIPALFITLGAVIGTSPGFKVLRWIGISILIGGGLAFALSQFTGDLFQWGMGIGPQFSHHHMDEVGRVVVEKFGDFFIFLMHHLFSNVNTVAGTVCILGIVLIAISFLIIPPRKTSSSTRPGTPSSQQPKTPSPDQSSKEGLYSNPETSIPLPPSQGEDKR